MRVSTSRVAVDDHEIRKVFTVLVGQTGYHHTPFVRLGRLNQSPRTFGMNRAFQDIP
jgi:hypothetical protein